MQNALYRVGLRARIHSQTSSSVGSHFTPSNYTPTSDTPNSGHSGQFTPNTLAHSPYLSKSPSFHRSPGTVTPPAVSSLQLSSPARQYHPQEMKPTDEEDPGLLPLEPSRSASGSGVPYNMHAYQNSSKAQGGRFRYDLINRMPWSNLKRGK